MYKYITCFTTSTSFEGIKNIFDMCGENHVSCFHFLSSMNWFTAFSGDIIFARSLPIWTSSSGDSMRFNSGWPQRFLWLPIWASVLLSSENFSSWQLSKYFLHEIYHLLDFIFLLYFHFSYFRSFLAYLVGMNNMGLRLEFFFKFFIRYHFRLFNRTVIRATQYYALNISY